MREWSIQKLNKVSKIVNGGTPKTKVPEYWGGDINWITPKDLGQLESIYTSDTPRTVTEFGLKKSSAKEIPSNSVILSTRAPIGHLAINTVSMAFNQGCRGIVPGENLDTKYLYYFLYKSIDLLNKLGTGATFKELSARALKSVEIPIPPLPEQKRIVAILDEAFEAIGRAKTNIERNIENAEELFQNKLEEVFSQRGEGWEEFKVKDLGEVQTGTTPSTKDESNYGDYIPFIKPGHFQTNGSLIHKESMLSEKGLENGRLIDKKSVLMVCIGASIGKTGYTDIPVSSNQQINAVTPKDEFNAKLIYFGMISRYFFNQVLLNASQTTLPIINKTKWSKLKLNLPTDKKVQIEIVSNLDEIRTETLSLIDSYNHKLDAIDELKKSILQKAFSGELTANEHVAA